MPRVDLEVARRRMTARGWQGSTQRNRKDEKAKKPASDRSRFAGRSSAWQLRRVAFLVLRLGAATSSLPRGEIHEAHTNQGSEDEKGDGHFILLC